MSQWKLNSETLMIRQTDLAKCEFDLKSFVDLGSINGKKENRLSVDNICDTTSSIETNILSIFHTYISLNKKGAHCTFTWMITINFKR